jgi:hypothetical protein
MSTADDLARRVPALAPLLSGADHVDVKQIDGEIGLRAFVAGMLSYQPWWVQSLYAVRSYFVRLLGMKQAETASATAISADEVAMTAGSAAAFFTVTCAEEERHWVAEATESHLTAYLGVVVEPRTRGRRFHVLTIVRYHRWTGPVYFNAIRPFHHVVVRQMMRAAVKARTAGAG